MNNNICCFTGHRPEGLGIKLKDGDLRYILLKKKIKEQIEKAIDDGYNHFISGMAIGSDLICASLILEFKKNTRTLY